MHATGCGVCQTPSAFQPHTNHTSFLSAVAACRKKKTRRSEDARVSRTLARTAPTVRAGAITSLLQGSLTAPCARLPRAAALLTKFSSCRRLAVCRCLPAVLLRTIRILCVVPLCAASPRSAIPRPLRRVFDWDGRRGRVVVYQWLRQPVPLRRRQVINAAHRALPTACQPASMTVLALYSLSIRKHALPATACVVPEFKLG